MSDSSNAQDLEEVGKAYATALATELQALVGVEVQVAAPDVASAPRAAVLAEPDPIVVTRVQNPDEQSQTCWMIVPHGLALAFGCMLLEHPEDRIKEMRGQPLDAETLGAFDEVAKLGTSVLSRIFADDYALPPLVVESTSQVDAPQTDSAWLNGDAFAVARFAISLPDGEESNLRLVFAPNAAHEWFGDALEDLAEGAGRGDEEEVEIEETSVVFIDPSEEVRNDIEDMGEELGHSIWTIDPDEFDPEELDEFAEVGAFFIEWDLATRTGLDLLECLRGEELTAEVPILMMSATPNEAMVLAALRSGADSFICKPIELDELHARLDPLLRARQRERS